MKIFKPTRVSNALALKLLEKNSNHCIPHVESIRTAYLEYLKNKGDPSKIKSLGLPQSVSNEIYEFYKSKRKRDGLQWIGKYRLAKGLSHCPLCGNSGPSHLEHYLPRSPYSEFTLFSWNLLPSCGLCNGKRGNHANKEGELVPLIHPYFDGPIYGKAILSAQIIRPFETVKFVPIAIKSFPPEIYRRIKRQVDTCVDIDRFNEQLISDWNRWRGKASEYIGFPKLKEELNRELRSTVGPTGSNSWAASFLRGLLADDEAIEWISNNSINISTI